jgi:hypothetical protein
VTDVAVGEVVSLGAGAFVVFDFGVATTFLPAPGMELLAGSADMGFVVSAGVSTEADPPAGSAGLCFGRLPPRLGLFWGAGSFPVGALGELVLVGD